MRARPQIGFLAALSPRPTMAKAGAPPSPSNHSPKGTTPPPVAHPPGQPTFKIFDARLEGLNAVFDFPDWTLTLQDVRASGSLAYDMARGARPAFTFDVANADIRAGGHLTVRAGPAQLAIPFTRAWLNHVATNATAPDQILLSASPVMVAGSRVTFTGRFTGVYANGPGRSPAPGMEAEVGVEDAVPAVRAVLQSLARPSPAPELAGDAATMALQFSGVFAALTVAVNARGFDVRHRGFQLRDVALRASGQPAGGRARLAALTAMSPGGGTLSVTGALEQLRARAAFTFRRFSLAPALPPALKTLAAGTVDGVLEGAVALAPLAATIDTLTLALTRPPGVDGPPVIRLATSPSRRPAATPAGAGDRRRRVSQRPWAPGQLSLPAVTVGLWGGAVTVGGTIALKATPTFDVKVDARTLSLQRIVGSPLLGGALSFHARIAGPLDHLSARVHFAPDTSLRLLSERFSPPRNYVFALALQGLTLPLLRLQGGHGGALTARGQLGLEGLDLDLGVQSLPFDKLPALTDNQLPLTGQLTGEVHLTSGGPSNAALAAKGQLSLQRTTYQGRPLGDGALMLIPAAGGGLRVRGQLVNGLSLDGTVTPTPAGLTGDAMLAFNALVLDPFLVGLPGHFKTAGLVSGTARAHMAAGAPPTIEARFNKLTLIATTPKGVAAHGTGDASDVRSPPPLEMRAEEEVAISVQPARSSVRLKPVRFVGGIGAIEVGGELVPGQARATGRGRLDLAALLRLAPPVARPAWLRDPTGKLDVDLEAIFRSNRQSLVVTGDLEATARATVRILGTPLPVALTNGRVDFAPASGKIDLPLTVAGSAARVTGGWTLPPIAPSGTLINQAKSSTVTIDAVGDLNARALESVAPAYVHNAAGSAHFNAHLGGTPEQPRFAARLVLGGLSFLPAGARSERISLAKGQVDVTEGGATLREVQIQLGTRARLVIGGSAPARVRFSSPPGRPFALALAGVDVPLQGEGLSFATRTSVVDDVRMTLRLAGQLPSPLTLTGDVELVKARLYTRPRNPATSASATNKSTPDLQRWLRDPAIQQMRLDLRVRSRGAAITVDIPYAPDVRLDVDYQVRGTAQRPQLSGDVRSTSAYSALALSLYRLFK